MSDKPKVSVIVPVYNVERFLRRCLDSVLTQLYDNYEVICVNDCSPDNSQDILDEYEKKYAPKMRVLMNEHNLGLGKSRERAIREASGEYIMFVDSDDYLAKDYIQTYVDGLSEGDYDIVVGGYIRDIEGELIPHYIPDSKWSIVTYPIACAKLFRKSFIVDNDLDFSDIRCGEDIYFSACVFCKKPTYKILRYAGYYYYLNRNSITGSMNYDKNHEEFIAKIFANVLAKNPVDSLDEDTVDVIEYSYLANMINALVTYGHGCGIQRMRQKYDFYRQDLLQKFPEYRKNRYIGIGKISGQTIKIRMAVNVTMFMERLKLDKAMFCLISLF